MSPFTLSLLYLDYASRENSVLRSTESKGIYNLVTCEGYLQVPLQNGYTRSLLYLWSTGIHVLT